MSNNIISYEYKYFIQDLFIILHFVNRREGQTKRIKHFIQQYGGKEAEPLYKTIYTNLMVGEKLKQIGEVRENLPIYCSPYLLFGMNKYLLFLSSITSDSFYLLDYCNDEEQNLFLFDAFFENLDDFDWDYSEDGWYHSQSFDSQFHVAVKNPDHTFYIINAKVLGILTPEKAKEYEEKGIDQIMPLYITFQPMQSFKDFVNCTKNILNLVPPSIIHADKFTQALVDHINRVNEEITRECPIVPVFLGFSMGAMFATAMAVKYGFSSVVFNPLGLGKGIMNFIGEKNLRIARDENHAHCYQSYFMMRDWVTDHENNYISKLFVFKPLIGQSYMITDFPKYVNDMNSNGRHNYISYLLNKYYDISSELCNP